MNPHLQIIRTLIVLFTVLFYTIPQSVLGQSNCNLNNFVTYTQGGWGSKGGKVCEGVTFITVKQLETGAEVSKGNGTDKLGANTTFTFPNGKSIVIHTSCSQPIYVGMTVTSDGFTYKITQLTTIPFSSPATNPGTIRDMYFHEVFPSGLEVGGIYKLKLTSAYAVEKFLPQGGTPKALDKNYVNPTSTAAGVFAGQVVALQMNVSFNDAGKIGSGSVKLGQLIVNAGPLAGKTVYEVLALANTALGGSTTPYTILQLNDAVTAINENFKDGKYNKKFLRCPEIPQKASISGSVFFDLNNNGIFDLSEFGLPNVKVYLLSGSSIIDSTLTDGFGFYKFTNLNAGTYSVKVEDPYQLILTNPPNPKSVTVSTGEHKTNINFGYRCGVNLAKISGYVYVDENKNGIKDSGELPLANVTIKLYDGNGNIIGTTTTNSAGYYEFSNLIPEIYTIEEIDPDLYRSTTPNFINLIVSAGQHSQNNNFGDILSADVCGIVFHDFNSDGIKQPSEPGIKNVLIELFEVPTNNFVESVITGVNGEYCFSYLIPGTYKIKETDPPGYISTTPNEIIVTLNQGDKIYNKNFGNKLVEKSSIAGLVWNDLNKNGIREPGEPRIPNIIVKLYDCSDNWIKEVLTNSLGEYKFDTLISGLYQVLVELPGGFEFSPMNVGTDDNFDSDINPIGWKSHCITLGHGQHITNIDAGMSAIPQNFCSIGDKVWKDLNMNGIQDYGEPGVPNITVKLFSCSTSTPIDIKTTNAQGYYLFTNIPSGNYFLKFENLPSGYTFTIKDAGNNDFIDSDVDPLTGKTPCFPVQIPNCDSNSSRWDAGIISCPQTFSISGIVYNDANGNGIKDAGEVGIPNVLIKLWGTSANLIATTLTNALGQFSFTNVLPGDYHVQEIDPPGYISTTPNSFFVQVVASNISNILFGDRIKPVPEPCDLTKYVTYTQDQWCMEPAKSLLLNKFNLVFGSSMVIGGNGGPYTITFSSANAVKSFFPQIGAPGALNMNYINPITTSAGQFAGNVAALTLNVLFNDSGYLGSSLTTKLRNLVISSGPLKDYKVGEVLLLANKALGGGITAFSIQTLNDVVSQINYAFSCNCNTGFLICPPPPDSCGGGFDAGVESNSNLADLLLQRLTKIEYGMTTKILRNPKATVSAKLGLRELIPQVGPLGSKPVESTPFDILGISNATSAFAFDYNLSLAKGDVRIASVFATTTNPPFIYEHTKAICDRLINAELDYITQVRIQDNYFFASVINKLDEGVIDYTIHFSIYEIGNKFVVDSRWLIEDYRVPSGTTNIYNFQVWGSNFQNAIYLTELILNEFKSRGEIKYLNQESSLPTPVFVKKGKYNHDGNVELVINNAQLTQDKITIKIVARKVQNGARTESFKTFTLNPGYNSILLNTGIISDANIYISSTNGFKDEIFVSGGAFTYLTGPSSQVSEFVTNTFTTPSMEHLPKGSMVLSGGVKLNASLNDWVTIFRSLTANTSPYDLSDYYAIRFTIKGYGKVQFRIEQDGIRNFDFHHKELILDGSEQTFTIPFSEFRRSDVSSKLDPSLIRKLSIMIMKSTNPQMPNVNIELKDIIFLKKDSEKNAHTNIPKEFKLAQNYPNPFNPSTLIEYTVAKTEKITIKVYNVLGKEIATIVDEIKDPGIYSVRFDAKDLSSGIYFYKLQSESYSAVRKMILQK